MALDVYFVLPPNLLLVDLAGPADAFRIAAQFGLPLRSHYVAPTPEVSTSLGLGLLGAAPLPRALPDGALVVISGASHSIEAYARPEAREIVRWLRRELDPGRHRVACICSSDLLAAEARVLDGRHCTTHHTLLQRLQQLAPRAKVQQNRVFVQDGPICSSAGITAGVDLALHLIAELAGPGPARGGAPHGGVFPPFRRRSGVVAVADSPQPSAPGGAQGAGSDRRRSGAAAGRWRTWPARSMSVPAICRGCFASMPAYRCMAITRR